MIKWKIAPGTWDLVKIYGPPSLGLKLPGDPYPDVTERQMMLSRTISGVTPSPDRTLSCEECQSQVFSIDSKCAVLTFSH